MLISHDHDHSAQTGSLAKSWSYGSGGLALDQTLAPIKTKRRHSFPSHSRHEESPSCATTQGDRFAPFGGCRAKLQAGLRRQELSCPLRALGNGFCQLHSHMAADEGEVDSFKPQKLLHVSKSGTAAKIRAWHPPIQE